MAGERVLVASGGSRCPGVVLHAKAKPDEQASLIAIDAETFAVAPYVGQHGWVQGWATGGAGRRDLGQTAPKRLVAAFDQRAGTSGGSTPTTRSATNLSSSTKTGTTTVCAIYR